MSCKNRIETVDVVGSLVAAIDTTITIDSVVDNGGSYTVTTCNTKYLRPRSSFIHDGITYTVIDTVGNEFVHNESFTVTGASIVTGTVITLDPMKYYHGTVIATSVELDKEKIDTNKFPMVYLLEVIQDRFNNLEEERIDRVSDFKLFFLVNTDEENWKTDDHYKEAIKPMRNMVYQFIDELNENQNIGEFNNFTAINHAKFGVYISDKGHTRRIFNDKTSGVEVRLDLPIIASQLCLTCN